MDQILSRLGPEADRERGQRDGRVPHRPAAEDAGVLLQKRFAQDLGGRRLRCAGACQLRHALRVHVAHHDERHVVRPVERVKAQLQNLRRHPADGRARARDRGADGVAAVERPVQPLLRAVGRGVGVERDLVGDDFALGRHGRAREIRRHDHAQQQLQAVVKVFGAGKIIAGHGVVGEGVHLRAEAGKGILRVAVRQGKHAVLEKMRRAVRHGLPAAALRKLCVA